MHGKKRMVLVLATVGILVPAIVLAFLFLHIVYAAIITLFAAPVLLGVVLGGASHRREGFNQAETRAAQRGDSAFFNDPRRQ